MRISPHLRLLSGLIALGVALPTIAHADDRNIWAEGNDDLVTVTGTTRTQVQSPGRPDTGAPRTGGADGDGGAAASADGAGGGATELCYLGEVDRKEWYSLSCLFAPAAPDPGGGGAGGEPPTTVTITATDAAALLVDGSGLHRQPPGPQALITLDVIAYTSPDTRTITTTVANTPVTVTATPTAYTFDWGDGTTTTTTDPGAPYPHHTITHRYQRTATAVTITLTTTWTATLTPDGGSPRPVQGTITTTETTPPFDIVRTITYLTDDAEEAQGH